MLLLAVSYYYNSGVLMVDKRVLVLSPIAAISYSLLSLSLIRGLFMIPYVNQNLLIIIFCF